MFIKRLLLYCFLLIVLPALALGVWFVFAKLVPQLPAWWVVLGIQISISLVMTYVFAVTRADGMAMALREEELLTSQHQFEQLYEHSPVPYLTVDSQGKIISSNLAAIRLFKAEISDLNGLHLLDRFVFDDENDRSLMTTKLKSGVTMTETELVVHAVDGTEYWVLASIFAYKQQDERLVTLVDVSHQKVIDQAKSEFVALAAHQLRTPIAAIRWNVELLKGQQPAELPPEQERYYVKIERNVHRMVNLINDFLSVSKLETGTFATESVDINLSEFIDSILVENHPNIDSKHLEVSKNYSPSDVSFKADARLWHIVINNLVSNSTKYVSNGDQISVGYVLSGSNVVVTVADTGIGIPDEDQDKLFTKFFRASNARKHKSEGTGLGLYIVKQSVEMMGGTIELASKEGVGTTFVMTVPVKFA